MARGFLNSAAGGGGGGSNGVFIIDTSLLMVDDIIKIQSMTDPTKVWIEDVTSTTGYMIFEVPGKDYYKISLLQEQEVSGETVEVEIMSVLKTLDSGQAIVTNIAEKNTLAGLQAILDAHAETSVINIGDELEVEGHIYQVAGINLYASHEIILASKYLQGSSVWGRVEAYTYSSANCSARIAVEAIYANFSDDTKRYIKPKNIRQDAISLDYNGYLWLPTSFEVFGSNAYSYSSDSNGNVQFPLFYDAASRCKKTDISAGANSQWWTATRSSASSGYYLVLANESGAAGHAQYNNSKGLLPCFHLTADV